MPWKRRVDRKKPARAAGRNARFQSAFARQSGFEPLEDRTLLTAVITVNSTLDTDARDGVLTLREALEINNRTLLPATLTAGELAQVSGTPTNADTDTIAFNIPGSGVQTIGPAAVLPTITDPVIIDGYTQPGASVNTLAVGDNAVLLVAVDGSSNSFQYVLDLRGSGNSTVRGLNIIKGYGINVQSDNNTVAGNFIGVDSTGMSQASNAGPGVTITTGANNLVGGTTPAARNVISGNALFDNANISVGLNEDFSHPIGTIIRGNYIGTNAAGTAGIMPAQGSARTGIRIGGATNTTIGGGDADDGTLDGIVGARNVISGNNFAIHSDPFPTFSQTTDGLTIQGNFIGLNAAGTGLVSNANTAILMNTPAQTDHVLIGGTAAGAGNVISGSGAGGYEGGALNLAFQGNLIGTDATGSMDFGNNLDGIHIALGGNEGPNFQVTIGGTTPAARNVISGNNNNGIYVTGVRSGSVTVQGNYIGTQIDGSSPLPNAFNGIQATRNVAVGGTAAGAGNVVAFNVREGVTVSNLLGLVAPILGNSIYSNGPTTSPGLGIDLAGGLILNDAGDADTGANNWQNYPVLTSASATATAVTIKATLNSNPNSSFRVEFFASPTADPSGYGEGKTYLGFQNVTTNGSGDTGEFTFVANGNFLGQVITTTATTLEDTDQDAQTPPVPLRTSEFSGNFPVVVAVSSADLQVTKTDGVTSVTPGASLTYTIVVSNAGPSAVTGARVTDTLPVGFTAATYTASSANGASGFSNGGGNIDQLVNLPVGSSVTYLVTGTVSPTATGSLSNTATVSPPDGTTDINSNNSTAVDTDTLTPQGDLSITKTDGVTSVTPGASLTYTIVVSNAGPSAVTGARVTDNLPVGFTGATYTASSANGASGFSNGGGNIDQLLNLPVGSSVTYLVTGTVSPTATGSLSNTATVSPPVGTTDINTNNSTAVDTDTLTPQGDLAITKTDGVTSVTPGASLTYTIVVSNAGPSAVTGARVTDTLPAGFTSATYTASSANGASGFSNGGGDIDQLVNLPVGSSVTYLVTGTVNPTATGLLSNTATVSPPVGTTDINTNNSTAVDTDTLTPQGDLAITKTDGVTSVTPGASLTYTIVVSNAGPSAVTGARVTDNLPAGFTSATYTASSANGASGFSNGGGDIDQLVNLPVGSSVTYLVTGTVNPTATGLLSNTATVSPPSGTTDINTNNSTAVDTDSITPGNSPPVANNDPGVATNKDTAVVVNVLANDSDPDGTLNPTTVVIVGSASNGTTSVNPTTGAITYTPAANYTGPDSFTYKVKDNSGADSNVATVSITVNAPPIANNDPGVTTNKDTAVVINVLANDSDPDGTINPTTVTVVGHASHGNTSVNPTTGAVTYTPAANYTGPDSFTYKVKDNSGADSNVATVSISVNSPPIANNDPGVTTNKDTAVVINVLANDSDPDGTINPTTVTVVGHASHGNTSVNPTTGAITYTPAANYTGPDSFTYKVKDNSGADSNVATVSITVNAPPIANNDPGVTTNKDTAVVINVLANDSDPDGTINPTTVTVVGPASHGNTSVNPTTGAITYTPAANYTGSDSFTYKVKDNSGADSNVATVSISVTAPTVVGTIAGTIYLDVTGNGLTADDTPQSGVKVYLDTNNNGAPNTGEPTTTTLANGAYAFTGLGAGTYKVREVVPTGYVRTAPVLADFYTITIASGQTSGVNNFSNAELCDCSILTNIVYVINATTPVSDLRGASKEGDTVEVSFTVAAGTAPHRFTLVTYTAPGPTFDPNTASQQKLFDTDSGIYGPGSYTLTVSIPHSYYQIDFVCGSAIDKLGPANSNIFYSNQNRLFSADNSGTHAVLASPGSLTGTVYRDASNNGAIDAGDQPIAGVKVTATAGSTTQTVVTDTYGVYTFDNLPAGTYTITETQPGNYTDGKDTLGNKGGTAANDKFSGIVLSAGASATGYNFGEQQTVGSAFAGNQTQSIAWWNGATGQTLIKALNGGQTAKNLGNWLAANFNNLFGADAGSANNLAGKTNAQVAAYYQSLYANAARKPEAETLALALSVYVTNSGLAGSTATSYGFAVSATGLGTATVSVGVSGAAFGVNNNTVLTFSELLSRTNARARKGLVWDANANGSLSTAESVLRSQISSLFGTINNA